MAAIVLPGGDARELADRIAALLPAGCQVGVYYGDPGGGIVKILPVGGCEPFDTQFLLRGTRLVVEDDGTWRIEPIPTAAAAA
jgi:hypothetical protein